MDTGIRTDTTGCVTITIGMCIVTITIMHGTHGTHTDTINIASQWCFWPSIKEFCHDIYKERIDMSKNMHHFYVARLQEI